MTICEWALVIPLMASVVATLLGVPHETVFVPYAIAQIVGILAYLDQQNRHHWRGH